MVKAFILVTVREQMLCFVCVLQTLSHKKLSHTLETDPLETLSERVGQKRALCNKCYSKGRVSIR